jgi:ABC-2 type transport system permease protein
VLFNVAIGLVQAFITVLLAAALLGVPLRPGGFALLTVAVVVGTAGWFFFYAIFALAIRRNDAFNTITSIFYFVFLFASSMFYPIDPLPAAFRAVALVNPITWHVDVMRFATIGIGDPQSIALEAAGFVTFTLVSFAAALLVLRREG